MRLWRRVRKANIPSSDRDILERYGEAVIAQVLSSIGSPAQELAPVATDQTRRGAARDWLTERGDLSERRSRIDLLLELLIIGLIGAEIVLSLWGLHDSRKSGAAQILEMGAMQTSLQSAQQALDRSVALASQQLNLVQGMEEPSVEIRMADPFQPGNDINLRNTGTQPIENVTINLRCFVFKDMFDKSPAMFFQGTPSSGEEHSWWFIPELRSGGTVRKDSSEALASFVRFEIGT